MDVDWITVAAQIVNFLVLVWLLKRYLYGPVVRAMDERDNRITSRLRETQEQKAVAEAEINRYRGMQEALEKQREERLAEVRGEADTFRMSLQAAAREDVAEHRAAWLRTLEDEKAAFLNDMRERSAEAFTEMARRALADLANETLESQIARRFASTLRDLDEGDLKKIRAAHKRTRAPVAVRTAFELPA